MFGLLAINMDALMKSLEIMWKGMLAIFVVIGVIILITFLLNSLTKKREKKDKDN